MKNLISLITIATFLFSCNQKTSQGKFTVNGQIQNASYQKVYLEELYFNKKEPEILDTTQIKNGKFVVTGLAKEEGLFRIRLEKVNNGFIFINDKSIINFSANLNDLSLAGPSFATPANHSLKNFIYTSDSLMKQLNGLSNKLNELNKSGAKPTDSIFIANSTQFDNIKNEMITYCFRFADTTQSPTLALFTATAAPVNLEKIQLPLQKLVQRFSTNNKILTVANFAKQQLALQQQQNDKTKVAIGGLAPEITLNDINDKPFSLSQIKGKFVLIDFWASWCGPCRAENPNVVAAYNQFKNKNFTVLGVSLDEDKTKWQKAIKDDGLAWQHISDLKGWQSIVTNTYGFDAIPFNVLIDTQGKVIATSLRGSNLINKLNEVLK